MLIELFSELLKGDLLAVFEILLFVVIVLISLTVHEFAHGYAAYKLGDPTAKAYGRLSLDPRAHLDLFGTIVMLLAGFGWAKPVPVNPNYFKNRKRGMAITAVAGPASNLIMAFVMLLLLECVYAFAPLGFLASAAFSHFSFFCIMFAYSNIRLALFNLIPVPPLDGSRLLNLFLPERYYFKIMRYERYIYLAVVLAVATGILSKPLNYLGVQLLQGFVRLIGLIPFLG